MLQGHFTESVVEANRRENVMSQILSIVTTELRSRLFLSLRSLNMIMAVELTVAEYGWGQRTEGSGRLEIDRNWPTVELECMLNGACLGGCLCHQVLLVIVCFSLSSVGFSLGLLFISLHVFLLVILCLAVSTSASNWLKRLRPRMNNDMLMGQ